MALIHQIVRNDGLPPKSVTRNVTPATEVTRAVTQPVTRDVTLEERVRLLEAKVALLEAGAPKASGGRAAYMREYRKRKSVG